MDLDPHLGDELFLAGHACQLPGLVDRLGQGFLGVDVQPLLHRPHGDRGVHVVGSGDVDRVEVFLLVEQLAPILVDLHIGEAFLDSAQVSEVDVGDRDQLDVGAGGERADVGGRHARGPKAGVVKGFARCGGRVGAHHGGEGEAGGYRLFHRGAPVYSAGRR